MSTSIRQNLLTGAKWTGAQVVLVKVFNVLGQFILAWILVPEDFGKIALVFSITSFAGLIQNFGISDVLVSRGKSFGVLLPLAQSLSILFAFSAFVLAVVFGFIFRYVYESQEILYLIAIFSLTIPLNTLSVLKDAKLRIDLKFKFINQVQVYASFGRQALTIILALLSFGVYSFVIAPVIVSIFRYLLLGYYSGVKLLPVFTLKRYRVLLDNSALGFLYSLSQRMITQGDYLLIGLYVSKAFLGIYFLAYSLSVQVIGLLVNSINPVLFPTLMKIPKKEKNKIKTVLLELISYMSLLGMPFAFWQAACAEPLILLFLNDNWEKAIPLVQILSIGIGFSVSGVLWAIAMRLRTDFKGQAIWSIISAVIFLSAVYIGVSINGLIGAATAITFYYFVMTPILMFQSFKHFEIRFKKLVYPLFGYFLLSLLIFGTYFYLSKMTGVNLWISLILNGIIAPFSYILILYLFDKNFKTLLLKLNIFPTD